MQTAVVDRVWLGAVCVISARPYGQRAVLKFGQYTGANYMAGRYTPGTFTNQIQQQFQEPRLLVITVNCSPCLQFATHLSGSDLCVVLPGPAH